MFEVSWMTFCYLTPLAFEVLDFPHPTWRTEFFCYWVLALTLTHPSPLSVCLPSSPHTADAYSPGCSHLGHTLLHSPAAGHLVYKTIYGLKQFIRLYLQSKLILPNVVKTAEKNCTGLGILTVLNGRLLKKDNNKHREPGYRNSSLAEAKYPNIYIHNTFYYLQPFQELPWKWPLLFLAEVTKVTELSTCNKHMPDYLSMIDCRLQEMSWWCH